MSLRKIIFPSSFSRRYDVTHGKMISSMIHRNAVYPTINESVYNCNTINVNYCRSSRIMLRSRQIRSSSSSSSSAFVDMLPESVKEAVKSKALNEAVQHNSKLWQSSASPVASSRLISSTGDTVDTNKHSIERISQPNSTEYQHNVSQISNEPTGNSSNYPANNLTDNAKAVHNQPIHCDHSSRINEPISRENIRLEMLHDPLDEWHLHSKPKSSTQKIFSDSTNTDADPFQLSENDMKTLTDTIRTDLLGSEHPVLYKVASYFFEKGQDGGKKVRPMMVLLLSRALAKGVGTCKDIPSTNATANTITTDSEESGQVLKTSSTELEHISVAMSLPQSWQRQDLPHAQQRLAEISEMIHTASLFHDDVIDGSDTRRGAPSVHKVFGNKMAILAGDYLLARASIFLARLRDVEVMETMSTIIEHLVRGEVMQMKGKPSNSSDSIMGFNLGNNNTELEDDFKYYLEKNFYKTASLMANSCKSTALLGGYDSKIVNAAYRYGKHLGIAFQIIDDVLDFVGNANTMGKPLLADLNAGLATAPVLYAAEEYPDELGAMIQRKFKREGDVERSVELIGKTDAIQRSKDLALVHAELAVEAILELRPSIYRDSLVRLAQITINRSR